MKNKKIHNQMKNARRQGMTALEVLQMKQIARNEAQAMHKRAREEAFIDMLIVSASVLAFDYWPKSARDRIPKYLKDVISLYDSLLAGAIDREDIESSLEENTGISISKLWEAVKEITKDEN